MGKFRNAILTEYEFGSSRENLYENEDLFYSWLEEEFKSVDSRFEWLTETKSANDLPDLALKALKSNDNDDKEAFFDHFKKCLIKTYHNWFVEQVDFYCDACESENKILRGYKIA